MNEATGVQNETSHGTWVAIGPVGAVGSIHRVADGFEVKLLPDGKSRGTYPSLDVAKNALHASLPPGTERPEFSEH